MGLGLCEAGLWPVDWAKTPLASGVFNNDGFDHVGRIFTFIRYDLHDLVDIPLFDDLFGIRLRFE